MMPMRARPTSEASVLSSQPNAQKWSVFSFQYCDSDPTEHCTLNTEHLRAQPASGICRVSGCVIYNPTSNRGRGAMRAQRLRQQRPDTDQWQWLPTRGPGDAERLAAEAARRGDPRVVAMGGDGTVHEVLNGLMSVANSPRPVLGVVPAGAGNDFAHVMGLSPDPATALAQACTGTARPIDVGRIADASQRQRFWANSVGTMLDGAINIESHRWRRPRGPARYLLAALRLLAAPIPVHATRLWVDEVEHGLDLVLFTVANGPREGGVFTIAPDARIDDGQFDYLAITRITRLGMLALLPRLLAGKSCRGKRVRRGQGRRLRLATSLPLVIHLDGELWTRPADDVHEVTIELLPTALQVAR